MTPNKVCCCTISWTLKKTPLDHSEDWRRRVLSEIAEAGFAGVELDVSEAPKNANARSRSFLRQLGY